MIRQDYLMRLAQRLAQALAQVLFRKGRQEYELAEAEIDAALDDCFDIKGTDTIDLDRLLEACRTEGPSDNLIRLAELFREKADIARLRGDAAGAARSRALALGLFLEVLQSSIVSIDLIQKTEELIAQTSGTRLPVPVLKRLLAYYEARGLLARAEDVLYEWLDTRDPDAPQAGFAFYQRASAKTDQELADAGLPRSEVEQGRAALLRLGGA
jgi:hypothetical protein